MVSNLVLVYNGGIVDGEISKILSLPEYELKLVKDENKNKVTVSKKKMDDAKEIRTKYNVIDTISVYLFIQTGVRGLTEIVA